MSTISRQEYDRLKVDEIIEDARRMSLRRTELGAQQLFDDSYPKSTAQAVEELNERGLAASDWRIDRYCKNPELAPQIIGNTRLWTKEDIDAMAAAMGRNGILTESACWRRDHGLTWKEEQAMLARHRESKKAVMHVNAE